MPPKVHVNADGLDVAKAVDFPRWYTQVVTRGGLIRYHDISGCYILRPPAMFIWEVIQEFVNKTIKAHGVRNCYFPLFVSKAALETEKEHVQGFSPEVAWVTKAGQSDLPQPVAIRPTSETVMYPSYADWIRSYRDLPLKLNQWCNVVRWEFKQPTPFIRSREFLWQEGHTAHATKECALNTVHKMLDMYRDVYENLLAVPVIQGQKSENEKFAGADMTTTVEAFIPANGRGVQAATSHFLGSHFSKMFGIEFLSESAEKQHALQTSWGLTTRTIGVMVMTHSDDKGLVLPPRVAEIQVVIVPIAPKQTGDAAADSASMTAIADKCKEIHANLTAGGVRSFLDDRTDKTPGFKFNQWELQGVPLRIEVGSKDLQKGVVTLVRRDTGSKSAIAEYDASSISNALNTMHDEMLSKARATLMSNIVKVRSFDEVMKVLNDKKLVLAPWCEDSTSEDEIKKLTKELSEKPQVSTGAQGEEEDPSTSLSGSMKTLCIPFESSGLQEPLPAGTKCFFTGKPAKRWVLWGRSY